MKDKPLKHSNGNSRNKRKSEDMTGSQSSNVPAKMDMPCDQSNTQTLKSTEQSSSVLLISKLSKLPLTSFIECCVSKDYSCLIISGNPDKVQLEQGWMNLYSQFCEAREDTGVIAHINAHSRLANLKLRSSLIALLMDVANSMGGYGCRSVKSTFVEFDSIFDQFQFTSETLESDLLAIRNMELNTNNECADIVEFLEHESKKNTVSKAMTESGFYDVVLSYNEIFKTSHSVDRLSTMEYARMCLRQSKYIENMNNNKDHG